LSDSSTTATRIRTITWEDPLITATAGQTMSGLQFVRAVQAGELPPPPIAVLMGFWITESSRRNTTIIRSVWCTAV
jgi:hypothetical protein